MNNGGPAFPVITNSRDACEGMSLRDYFAAKALQGISANPEVEYNITDLVEGVYKIADAMLMESEK